jgi:hypothetical protein
MKTTLVILAAGLGSRFGGNKQISHVGPHGEMLMEYSIHDAIEAGFDQIVFILKEEMVSIVKDSIGSRIPSHIQVDYAVQDMTKMPVWYQVPAERTKPFGTVHAVLCAKDVIGGAFATVNADDYYGKEAFGLMHEMLLTLDSAKKAAMVPYILGNTMSENGGVTRGVCSIRCSKLREVVETHEIHYDENRKIVGEFGELTGKEKVSMNIWGFHPAALDMMQAYFEAFLKGLTPEEIKAECLLPVMVNEALAEKKLLVTAKASSDKWFGITYQADRESVMEELKKLHSEGVYPEKLF